MRRRRHRFAVPLRGTTAALLLAVFPALMQAQAAGKPVEQYVREVLEAQVTPGKTLREISGAVQQRFIATGMSEEELAETLEREDHAERGVPYDE